jgi:hypothetical protein
MTMKMKQDKKTIDREYPSRKRFMEIDVDPGHDAMLGWIDKGEDAGTERTGELKGSRLGTASSKRRE